MEFTDLKIVTLDTARTAPSRTASALRLLYLKLSATPPDGWPKIFEGERSFPRHSMWRHAWIEGDHIVIDCVPEELERYHLKDLQQDVATTNAKYRDALAKWLAKKKAEADAAAQERKSLDGLKGRLKFD